MSQNTCIFTGSQTAHALSFPSFPSKEAVESQFRTIPKIWENYLLLPPFMRQEIVAFCMGKQGFQQNSGLHEDIFICLDSFHSIVHNVTKDSTDLDAWLTFLSATDPEMIRSLIDAFPCFASIYQEITDFVKDPEELITIVLQK